MGWYVLQTAIMLGAAFANVYYEITPNPYVVTLIGVGAAWMATEIVDRTLRFVYSSKRSFDDYFLRPSHASRLKRPAPNTNT